MWYLIVDLETRFAQNFHMKAPVLHRLIWLMAIAICSMVACKKKPAALAPVPVEQVPATIEQAFKQATPETGAAATDVTVALREGDEVKAFEDLQTLSKRRDLTAEQREAVTRSWLSMIEQLRAAAARGNKKAEEALEHYMATK